MNNIRQNAAAVWRRLRPDRLLTGLSVLLVALLLLQGIRYLLIGRCERSVLQSLTQKNASAPEREKAKPVQEYDETIMGHGMLGTAVKLPIKLWGVMGDSALFGTSGEDAQPAKVGDTLANGEKVVEIRVNEAVVEKDGKRRTEVVFEELKSAAPSVSAPRPGPKPGAAPPAPPDASPKGEMKPPAQAEGGAGSKPAR